MKPPMFRIAEVKAAESDNPNGEFEIVMSTDSVDRDGEVIAKGAFSPLPESIPVHAFHNFDEPIGRAFPRYDEQGRLVGRGFFGSDVESQKMRQRVADGVIGHTSVGFMAAERDTKDGVPHITKAELLEVSFVSVPANRDAAVTMVKSYQEAVDNAAESFQADLRCRVEELEAQVKSLLDCTDYKRWLVAKLKAKEPLTDRELNAAIDAEAEAKAAMNVAAEKQYQGSPAGITAHVCAALAAAQASTVL